MYSAVRALAQASPFAPDQIYVVPKSILGLSLAERSAYLEIDTLHADSNCGLFNVGRLSCIGSTGSRSPIAVLIEALGSDSLGTMPPSRRGLELQLGIFRLYWLLCSYFGYSL